MLKATLLAGVVVLALQLLPCQVAAGKKSPPRIPIVYTDAYSITILGIEYFHPFDTNKYKKVYTLLRREMGFQAAQFYCPKAVTRQELLTVHSKTYLSSLRHSGVIAKVSEIPTLRMIPSGVLDYCVLRPMRRATGGTLLGSQLALQYGWAINLSGGYHHAKADAGGGFCYYADIPIAALHLLKAKQANRILVVDLDAHQGNGVESILGNDDRVRIFDVFNQGAYPYDAAMYRRIDYKFALLPKTGNKVYLKIVEQDLPKAIEEVKPDFIFYNAGVDIHEADRLGGLRVSEKAIILRDALVFHEALKRNIPILMVLSGGYTPESASIIGKSIVHILRTEIKELP